MVTKIALVSCVKKKQCTPMPARYLYCSDWFRKASAYAMRIADEWYILSAKYGLVEPDRVIAPYDVTLNRMSAAERREWAVRVWDELKEKLKPGNCQEEPIDPPSPDWLGHWAASEQIRRSGLWNADHVSKDYDPGFLDVLQEHVGNM